ncbi:MAG: mechanosensitive ion channel family protein [Candidatus Omnitrophota bacterium]|nr:mechanosensitive ion channel family protein [Candidatus Omnitrophota bacterium]MDZ4241472.1 mechanosensitive ion channel family protein [Candidatus Omnitrophota bacterium]
MDHFGFFGLPVTIWLAIPLAYFLWVSVLTFAKRVVFVFLKRVTARTKTHLDDLFIHAADFPLTLWILASGGFVVERMLPAMEQKDLTGYFIITYKLVIIISVIMFVDRFINGLVKEYSNKIEVIKMSPEVTQGVIRIIVLGLGGLVLLDSFGVSITPVLASLGIGSLAVALALQPTLENFFAGLQLIIDKPVQVGHFIKLDSGEEGYVHKIGWWSSWIRLLPNNMIVLPNKLLVNTRILNYYYPSIDLAVLVQVGVHYQSNLEHVEKVTIEVGRQTMKEVQGGVPDFEPFIRFHTFDAYSINFSVILRGKEFVDNYLIKHEFIKRLHKRYAEEGIVIPYPIRALNYDQEKAFEPAPQAQVPQRR